MSWLDDIPRARLIGSYTCGLPGPLVLAIGGIHGNEPNGPRAIAAFLNELHAAQPLITGTFAGVKGNLAALEAGQRFMAKDLNRCFLSGPVAAALAEPDPDFEELDLKEISAILHAARAEFEDVCFMDCHTTSADTLPYLSINVHPESLQLAHRFPLHNVVGLQMGIQGCLSQYCNQLDFRGFTFEAGQHQSPLAPRNQLAMLWLMLVYSGVLHRNDCGDYEQYENFLARTVKHGRRCFRLLSHYRITKGERFIMQPGFANFTPVHRGALLATNRFGEIRSPADGYLLLPLYQAQGDDGFFLLEEETEVPAYATLRKASV